MNSKSYQQAYRAKHKDKLRRYHRLWKKRNKQKLREYSRRAYKKNPSKTRDKALRRKFGITLAHYETLRAAQNNRCAICGTDRPGGKGDWHVDHNHKTLDIRGLLCQNCNIGLGNFKDSPVLLAKAKIYLCRYI